MLDRSVGCIILGEPTFFEERDWIPTPPDWAGNIVKGRTYSTSTEIGAMLWNEVQARLAGYVPRPAANMVREAAQPSLEMYGRPALVRPRLGQGSFRLMTLDNYRHTCCITGETTRDVIEAAHILPVSRGGEHRLDNGLALRADMHILYDRGLLAIDPNYRVHVSPRIRHQYHNGVVYYTHEGQQLRVLPDDAPSRPNRDFLDRHYREAFIA
ncbi:MAG TPA: HNH endonuclease signature motif containing protein [Fimbriimonadaceae bacterium]|nr:HNH endonuclease signature motif containing protein [Fimbriimonadaceae bacterium]